MAASWTLLNAIASLRRRLSDGPTDKYRHQMATDPSPNGENRVFGVPEANIVTGSLIVYLNDEAVTPTSIDLSAGTFTLEAPEEGNRLFASYYFQWFTDADLTEFLQQAAQLLRFEDVTDSSIPLGLRTPVLTFACYYAYLKMAGQSAPALSASSTGFMADNSKEHPYWMDLARAAWEEAQKEVALYNENPISAIRPTMRFVSFRMQPWVPRT